MVEKKVILLVEDNANDVILTRRALKKANIINKVVVAPDGAEALDYLYGTGLYDGRDISVQPQVILLDLGLPKVGGLDVLKRIRADERTKHLPVVIMTASREDNARIKSMLEGANAFVVKPFNFTNFAEAVTALSLCWLVLGPCTTPAAQSADVA